MTDNEKIDDMEQYLRDVGVITTVSAPPEHQKCQRGKKHSPGKLLAMRIGAGLLVVCVLIGGAKGFEALSNHTDQMGSNLELELAADEMDREQQNQIVMGPNDGINAEHLANEHNASVNQAIDELWQEWNTETSTVDHNTSVNEHLKYVNEQQTLREQGLEYDESINIDPTPPMESVPEDRKSR